MAPHEPARHSGFPELTEADHAALRAAKSTLRAAVRQRRQARPPAERDALDARRFARLAEFLHPHLRPNVTTACYLSAGTEPGTLELVAWLGLQSRVLLPVLGTGRTPITDLAPAWAPYRGPDRLRTGRYGLAEPTSARVTPDRLAKVPVVICPALAVSRRGHRLGAGGGWYDRALDALPNAIVVALSYDDEVLDDLPSQPWDRGVDVIATESRLLATA